MKPNKLFTIWLAIIIIGIFILQNLPGIPGFTDTFILNNKAKNNFQFWRYLTAIFLHGDITHLAFNLFALLFFGLILEKLIGSNRFLLTYLFTGILANIISVNFYNSSLGASGAIYGIIGAVTILRPTMMVWAFGLIMPMFLTAILYISADILRTIGAFGPSNIGSIAHLSGIAVGIILGIYFKSKLKSSITQKNNQLTINFNEQQIKNWEDNLMKG